MNSKQQEREAKSAVGEVGSGSRFADLWNSRRAKPTTDGARWDKTAEIDWRGSVVNHLHVIDLQFRGCIQHPLRECQPGIITTQVSILRSFASHRRYVDV